MEIRRRHDRHARPEWSAAQVVDAEGWTFTSFDTTNRPLIGSKGTEAVTVKYMSDGSSVWLYGDGTEVTRNSGGTVAQMTTPDGWTFTTFDDNGRPVTGANGGLKAAIAYTPDGGSVWTFSDGMVVTRDAEGTITEMKADGWTFTDFDTTGRPIEGYKDGQHVAISYQANGNAVWDLGPGQAKLTYDKDGNLLTMETPDGWSTTSSTTRPPAARAQRRSQSRRDYHLLPERHG
jgi:hypothetical protein